MPGEGPRYRSTDPGQQHREAQPTMLIQNVVLRKQGKDTVHEGVQSGSCPLSCCPGFGARSPQTERDAVAVLRVYGP